MTRSRRLLPLNVAPDGLQEIYRVCYFFCKLTAIYKRFLKSEEIERENPLKVTSFDKILCILSASRHSCEDEQYEVARFFNID